MSKQSKVALVTGANKGIGRETARQLAERGFVVYLGSRDPERGHKAAQDLSAAGIVRYVRLDVTDLHCVSATAEAIRAEAGHLDVLVNNAGVALEISGPSGADLDIVRRTYEVNVL